MLRFISAVSFKVDGEAAFISELRLGFEEELRSGAGSHA